MIYRVLIIFLASLTSMNALADSFTRIDLMDGRIKSLIYTPHGWSVNSYEKPGILVSDPEIKTYATFNTPSPKIHGEIRVLKKGDLDAATVLTAVAEQTTGAKLMGSEIIFGTQELGAFRMLYEDKEGKHYAEQVISTDEIAVTIILSIDKDANFEEKRSVADILNRSEITIERK